MKRALLLSLILLAADSFSQPAPEAVFSGLGASLGRYPRVTAKLTYDRRQAAQGGMIYAVARAESSDAEAIRLSEGVVTTSGGLLSRAAVEARAHRVLALILSRASWGPGPTLIVDEPKFGPSKPGPGGLSRRVVEGTRPRKVAEGEVVTIDALQGTLQLYAAEDQQGELDFAEAVRAFEGLRDPQSLAHWFESRVDSGGALLAARVADESAERLLAGTVSASDFDKVVKSLQAALPQAQVGRFASDAKALAARLASENADATVDAAVALKEAGTESAARRLLDETAAARKRLAAAAVTLGSPAAAQPSAAAFSAFEKAANARLAVLKGVDSDWRAAAAAAGAAAPPSARLGGDFYRRFLDDNGLQPLIDDMSENASLDLRLKSERIRAAIVGAKLDGDSQLGKDIVTAAPEGDALHVETAEDSQRFVPRAKLLEAVKRAWASYWNPGPFGLRKRQGETLSPEVLIESAVPAEVSGLLFSRDPGTLLRDRVVVEAAWGERETLDEGDAPADEYSLDRRTGREVLPAVVAGKRCLTPGQLEAAARAARALDGHFGAAVEARLAWTGGKLSVLSVKIIASPRAIIVPSVNPMSAPAPDVEGVRSLR